MCESKFRLRNIQKCINEFIINENNIKISQAIEDKIIKPAIRMNIIKIAEQFNKLKDDGEFEILSKFKKEDLRGINALRNYIAHDYDSTDDEIVDNVLRYKIPLLKQTIEEILQND